MVAPCPTSRAGPAKTSGKSPSARPSTTPSSFRSCCAIFAAWFGYDAFFNVDEHMQQYLTFNRIGFPIALVFAVYFTIKGLREKRAEAERRSDDAPLDPGS